MLLPIFPEFTDDYEFCNAFSQLKIHCEWYDGASKTESTFWGGNSQSESTSLEKNVPSKDWGNFVVPDTYEQHMLGPRTGATVASSNQTTRRELVVLVNGGFGCGKQQLCLCVCVVAWMLGWADVPFGLREQLQIVRIPIRHQRAHRLLSLCCQHKCSLSRACSPAQRLHSVLEVS